VIRRRRHKLHPRWDSIDALTTAHPELRLDLGCGFTKPDGFVGLDDLSGSKAQIQSDNAPDLYIDLTRDRIPFDDDACEEIRASHFLEHVPHDRIAHVFDEVHRLLRPGGTFFLVVPYGNSADGMLPGHEVFLTEKFFDLNMYFQDRFLTVDAEWDAAPEWDLLPQDWRQEIGFDVARRLLFNVCSQMKLWATPRKGDWAGAAARTCEQAALERRAERSR
jgi:SAM-dependent methyltransferase